MNQLNQPRKTTGSNDMLDVSNPDVAKMSPAALQAYIDSLIIEKAKKEKEAFNTAIQDINQIIAEKIFIDGVKTIHDLSAYLQTIEAEAEAKAEAAKLKSRTKKERRAVTQYWRHRTNLDLKWTGRGQVIGWLRDEMVNAGKDPNDREAVKAYCTENLNLINNNNAESISHSE